MNQEKQIRAIVDVLGHLWTALREWPINTDQLSLQDAERVERFHECMTSAHAILGNLKTEVK